MKRAIYTSVVLSAFAVGFVSNAHAVFAQPSWFDAGIDSYVSWPSDGSDTNIVDQGTWSGTANATLDTESPTKALVVNAAGDSKLTFEVDTKVNAETTNATYNATMTASGDGVSEELTKSESLFLRLLASERGRCFSFDEIFAALRGEGYVGDDNAVRCIAKRLKAKLGRAGELISNARGVGYKLVK